MAGRIRDACVCVVCVALRGVCAKRSGAWRSGDGVARGCEVAWAGRASVWSWWVQAAAEERCVLQCGVLQCVNFCNKNMVATPEETRGGSVAKLDPATRCGRLSGSAACCYGRPRDGDTKHEGHEDADIKAHREEHNSHVERDRCGVQRAGLHERRNGRLLQWTRSRLIV